MLSQDEQVALFVDAINKDALKMCREIEKETKKFYTAQTQKLEEAAKENMARRLEYAEKDIMTQLNRKAASYKAALKRDLYKRREELTDDVFKKAQSMLIAFTNSDGYGAFLEKSIESIISVIKNDIVLYVKPGDKHIAYSACEKKGLSCPVKEDESIIIGGVRGESMTDKKIADDTLDQRLLSQYDIFLSHTSSELNI